MFMTVFMMMMMMAGMGAASSAAIWITAVMMFLTIPLMVIMFMTIPMMVIQTGIMMIQKEMMMTMVK